MTHAPVGHPAADRDARPATFRRQGRGDDGGPTIHPIGRRLSLYHPFLHDRLCKSATRKSENLPPLWDLIAPYANRRPDPIDCRVRPVPSRRLTRPRAGTGSRSGAAE